MFKNINILFMVLILLLTTACDVTDNLNNETQVLNFSINKMSRGLLKQTEAIDLSSAKKAIISLSAGEYVEYENHELELISWGDEETFRTDIIEVKANVDYSLTQFELRDENDVTIFAAPITGAPFSNLVNSPLPLQVKSNKNEQNAVLVEVLSTEESTPSDFGYPYFDVKLMSKDAFSVVVKADGNLIESKLKLKYGVFEISKDLGLGKNIINFDTSFDEYILEVFKDEYVSYVDTICKEDLIGKHISVTLQKGNGSSTSLSLSDWSDYVVNYVDIFPNENNTGIKGVGLTKEDLTASKSIHIYGIGKIYHIEDGIYTHISNAYPDNLKYDSGKNELIIENMNITDGINILECGIENIIIRNCYITNGLYGVNCKNSDDTFITIENCTITSPEGSQRKGILANNCIIKRCDISNYQDGIYWVNKAIIESNYIHDLHTFEGAHADGLQGAGKNIVIVNNYVDVIGHNACIMTSDQTGPMENFWAEHNYFRGGNYVVYVRKADNPYVPNTYFKNIRLKNNIFEKDAFNFGYTSITEDLDVLLFGNTDENGNLHTFNNQ